MQIGSEITGVTTFEFKGIDAGEYKLVETTVPSGYNKADDITFTVIATYDTEADDPKLKTLQVSPDTAGFAVSVSSNENDADNITTDGIITGTILNQKGSTLPSTGGSGTTMFYIIGGLFLGGAGVLIIVNNLMKGSR